MEPRFKGPYKINGYTKRGNYIVTNALNETLKDSYQRHKVKVVNDDSSLPNESAEVERIIKHKVLNNEFFYLIKWKNLPVSESSWIPERYFNSTKMINEYKASINNINNSGNTRPKRKCTTKNINNLTILLILYFLFPFIYCDKNAGSESMIIKGRFKVCSHSFQYNLLDFNSVCQSKPIKPKRVVTDFLSANGFYPNKFPYTKSMLVFGKLEHLVYGNGYHCLMKKHILTTSMSFWGEKFESLRTEPVKISRDECRVMIITKKCSNSAMTCDGEYCSYSANPIPSFLWLQERTTETFSCSSSPKLINAKKLTDNLFGTKCQVRDFFCILHDSIIVWDKAIIHRCPLYRISENMFTMSKNDSNILISNASFAVQATNIEQHCNVSVLATVEGIFLGFKTNDAINNKIPQSSTIDEMKELLLAENDYRTFEDITQKNDIIYNECLNFKSILNLFSKSEDKYLTHYLRDGSSITFYTTMGNVYKADCVSVDSIKLITDNRNKNGSLCFADQPVLFELHNSIRTGYLMSDGIIKQVSNLIPCNRVFQYIQLVDQSYTIIRNNYQSLPVPNSQVQFYKFDYLGNKIRELEAHHNPLLLDGIDLLSTFQEVVNHEMSA